MNLEAMERLMAVVVQDDSLAPEFARKINDSILEVAADFDLPALKMIAPVSLPVTSADWLYELPEDFHKHLFRCADRDYIPVKVHGHFEDLDRLDINHDEVADRITSVAVAYSGDKPHLGIFPMADDTLHLWYYRKPAVLKKPEDVCDCIPPEFQERVLFPKVVIKNYQLLQDQIENFDPKPLTYWEGKLKEGFYGSPQGPIGFINFLAKEKGGPRRRGGRDPIWTGWGWRIR